MDEDNKIIIKTFQELTNKEVYELLKLRFKVFVMEQGARYLDPDGIDYSSIHIFIKNDDESMVACVRIFPEDEKCVWHIGRVIAESRGKGVGKMILEAAAEEAKFLLSLHCEIYNRTCKVWFVCSKNKE